MEGPLLGLQSQAFQLGNAQMKLPAKPSFRSSTHAGYEILINFVAVIQDPLMVVQVFRETETTKLLSCCLWSSLKEKCSATIPPGSTYGPITGVL